MADGNQRAGNQTVSAFEVLRSPAFLVPAQRVIRGEYEREHVVVLAMLQPFCQLQARLHTGTEISERCVLCVLGFVSPSWEQDSADSCER